MKILAISLSSGYEIEIKDINEVKHFIKNQLEEIKEQTTDINKLHELNEYIQSVKDIKTINDCNKFQDIIMYLFEKQ